jgi:CheY-like chemotaxis protein
LLRTDDGARRPGPVIRLRGGGRTQTVAKKTVLLVEDDCDVRDALELLLKRKGYRVTCAGNGQEALESMRSAETPSPSLILLDLMMPVMNGWEFRAEQLKDPALAEIPVIVISADAEAEDHAASIGAVAYLKKPFEFTQLTDMIGSA